MVWRLRGGGGRLRDARRACLLLAVLWQLTWPPSTRHGGSLAYGGACKNGACYWFTNNVEIPSHAARWPPCRSMQLNVTGGVEDVFAAAPWRAPGSAPSLGSGCGVSGGGPTPYANGGYPQEGAAQGSDGLLLPPHGVPAVWVAGGEAEVAFALGANHAGGYSHRLCRADGAVDEACFQATPLQFVGAGHWAVFPNGSRVPLARTVVTVNGADWARVPVPTCYDCDAFATCGAPLAPPEEAGTAYDTPWNEQVNCYASCAGTTKNPNGWCERGHAAEFSMPGAVQFPMAQREFSGFKGKGPLGAWDWSILDRVAVPASLAPGDYLLSWRWDCEESTQVWSNCADVKVVDSATAATLTEETFAEATVAAIAAAPLPPQGDGGLVYGSDPAKGDGGGKSEDEADDKDKKQDALAVYCEGCLSVAAVSGGKDGYGDKGDCSHAAEKCAGYTPTPAGDAAVPPGKPPPTPTSADESTSTSVGMPRVWALVLAVPLSLSVGVGSNGL